MRFFYWCAWQQEASAEGKGVHREAESEGRRIGNRVILIVLLPRIPAFLPAATCRNVKAANCIAQFFRAEKHNYINKKAESHP